MLYLITLNDTHAIGRTPLDEGSTRRRDLTTHNTHKRQASMSPARFEPITPTSERSQTQILDRAVTGIGDYLYLLTYIN